MSYSENSISQCSDIGLLPKDIEMINQISSFLLIIDPHSLEHVIEIHRLEVHLPRHDFILLVTVLV
jgi:hypothetical protein